MPAWPGPTLLAELIGHASAAVGVSLHLAITALAFGVPVFRPAHAFRGKYEVLTAEREAARRQLAERHRELTERDHQLATRDHRLAEQERQLAEVRGRLAQREEELAAISATLGWRILTEYRRVARSSKILSITHAALTAQLKRWMRRG